VSTESVPITERERGRTSCAAICRRLGEPLIGTAPTGAAGWLLIEHPGPWPAYGLPSDVPAALARFAHRALEHGVRTQLIRRPDRTGRQVELPTVMIAGGPAGRRWIERRWIERRDLDDPRAFDALDPAGFAACAAPGFGSPVEAALLVCTHGRREVCCAKYGRPVAQALAARFAPLVWETTHVGGDRFAANLVVLPSGGYYGRLDPEDAVDVAQTALRGRIDLDRFRGTAGLPEAAQAAECLLRRALGVAESAAVRYLGDVGHSGIGHSGIGHGDIGHSGTGHSGIELSGESTSRQMPRTYAARFAVSGAGVRVVTLERCEAAGPRLTSCGTGAVEAPVDYRLLAITAAATSSATATSDE
jgi:(2Fe-2S) ferredoxin